ncbi:MAG: hypothetical protein JJT95_19525, partial [Pararhodobacter sp.]|nr:hypothetical protein [Pararhodobacter sp.]
HRAHPLSVLLSGKPGAVQENGGASVGWVYSTIRHRWPSIIMDGVSGRSEPSEGCNSLNIACHPFDRLYHEAGYR